MIPGGGGARPRITRSIPIIVHIFGGARGHPKKKRFPGVRNQWDKMGKVATGQ